MKKGDNGFAILELVLIVVLLGIVCFTGWFVLKAKQNTDKSYTPSSSTTSVATKKSTAATPKAQTKIDPTVHNVNITLQTTADLEKLPSYTPANFKVYMEKILRSNAYSFNAVDGVDTTQQYQITKISQVNILGGAAPVDKSGEGHAGGAPAIWVLTPNGTWDEESLNGPVCKSKNGGLIYEEFVEECYLNSDLSDMVKNPNGSIAAIKS